MQERLNILIIPGFELFPVTTGGGMAQIAFLEELQHLTNLSIIVTNHNVSSSNIHSLKQHLSKTKIYYIIEDEKQEPKPKLARSIYWKLCSTIGRFIFKPNEKIKENTHEILKRIASSTIQIPASFLIVKNILEIIYSNNFDIIQLEMHGNLPLHHLIPSNIKKIFVHHEVKFERLKTQIQSLNFGGEYSDYLLKMSEANELAVLTKFNAILTLTDEDKNILANKITTPLYTSPMPIRNTDFDFKYKFSTAKKIVFIGNEIHLPNKYAIEWFLNEVYISNYKKIGLNIHITGNWTNDFKLKYKNKHIIFEGVVSDLNTFLKESIMIVPVTMGAGIRTKILLAMAQGIPIISTTFAHQGIKLKHREHIFIANSSQDFLNEISFIKSNISETKNICNNARSFANQQFSQNKLVKKRIDIYKNILNQ